MVPAGNFSGGRYRGNIGVRYVHSRDSTDGYSYAPGGGYRPVNFLSSYGKWLPSFNIAYDLRDDLMLRFASSKLIARSRYTNMTPYVAADDTTLTASTGNPRLSPYESTNLGASLEWYFSDSSLLSGEFFSRDISNYILTTVQDRVFSNNATGGRARIRHRCPAMLAMPRCAVSRSISTISAMALAWWPTTPIPIPRPMATTGRSQESSATPRETCC